MRFLIALLPLVLVFGFLAGTDIYLAERFTWFFGIGSTSYLYWFFSLYTIFMLVAVIRLINATSRMGSFIFGVAAVSMGFMLYLIISTLVVDGIGLFINTAPNTYGLAAILLATLVSVYGIINAKTLRVSQTQVPIKGLANTIKAAHLTDTHLGHFRGAKTLQHIVAEINKQNVDVVFFTGDLLDSKIQLKPESMAPLKNLKAPVFFIEGNHDQYTGVQAIKGYLKSIGVRVLENEVTHWKGLQIVGLNHMVADGDTNDIHARRGAQVSVKSVLEALKIDADLPTVLLHHGPNGIKHANKAGVDLYLAGHTHAGQMWPATFIAKQMFEYNRGLHDYKGTKVYVCQGTGTFGPPMRVGTYSELAILHLVP